MTINLQIYIKDILEKTPASRIPKWKSTLRNAILISIDSKEVTSIPSAETLIHQARVQNQKKIIFEFALTSKSKSPSENLSSQLTFD